MLQHVTNFHVIYWLLNSVIVSTIRHITVHSVNEHSVSYPRCDCVYLVAMY